MLFTTNSDPDCTILYKCIFLYAYFICILELPNVYFLTLLFWLFIALKVLRITLAVEAFFQYFAMSLSVQTKNKWTSLREAGRVVNIGERWLQAR